MRPGTEDLIENITGTRPLGVSVLSGGCVGEVYKVRMPGGQELVAKAGGPGSGLAVEGFMLDYLGRNSALPVPEVLHASDTFLLMTCIPSGSVLSPRSQAQAADLLSALHDIAGETYGFERDTLIGGLVQPNPRSPRWIDFFRDHRLLYMAHEALDAGRLPASLMDRIETLAGRLDRWLTEPDRPSLIHGDMWTGNVLCSGDGVTGFVDPAIYFADAEIELAFSTLFGTFGDAFFRRYAERRPIRPGFFEERREIYNLYPLLVHARLFGGSYVQSVEGTLSRFGF
mgnify:CR=1 FL=1